MFPGEQTKVVSLGERVMDPEESTVTVFESIGL
jgi:hypothetical protein